MKNLFLVLEIKSILETNEFLFFLKKEREQELKNVLNNLNLNDKILEKEQLLVVIDECKKLEFFNVEVNEFSSKNFHREFNKFANVLIDLKRYSLLRDILKNNLNRFDIREDDGVLFSFSEVKLKELIEKRFYNSLLITLERYLDV